MVQTDEIEESAVCVIHVVLLLFQNCISCIYYFVF